MSDAEQSHHSDIENGDNTSDNVEMTAIRNQDADSTSNLLSPMPDRRSYESSVNASSDDVSSSRNRVTDSQRQAQEDLELKYGADSVVKLIKPVSVCMFIVIATIRSVEYFSQQDTTFVYTPFENPDASASAQFGGAILNALIFIAIILVMTVLLVICYKYRWYKVIHGWLMLSSVLLLFFFSYLYFTQVLEAQNSTIDWITMCFVIWNFGLVGLLMVHWTGPLLAQQCYLIAISALMALVLIKNLPEWTTWVIIGFVAIYDLFAVLSPCGPLKWLVEMSQDRDESLFAALTYSSGMMWIVTMAHEGNGNMTESDEERQDRHQRKAESQQRSASVEDTPANVDEQPRRDSQPRRRAQRQAPSNHGSSNASRDHTPRPRPQPQDDDDEGSGVKLGLGDFIFYSVLVGKAATANEWTTIMACFICILLGLAMTLFLLSIWKKALPALPISIFFGIIFYFVTSHVIEPLVNRLNEQGVFV